MSHQGVTSFRDLDVWRIAMVLAVDCYRFTSTFPHPERYGLSSQVRRAATSIPSNVAEGHARPTSVYRNHVSIALGSHAELDTLIELSLRLGYEPQAGARPLLEQLAVVGKMLHRLLAALDRKLEAAAASRHPPRARPSP